MKSATIIVYPRHTEGMCDISVIFNPLPGESPSPTHFFENGPLVAVPNLHQFLTIWTEGKVATIAHDKPHPRR